MNKTERFNSKMINVKIKDGWKMEQFLGYLQIDTEDEFKKELGKRFSPKACRDFIKRIEKNSKIKTKETRGSVMEFGNLDQVTSKKELEVKVESETELKTAKENEEVTNNREDELTFLEEESNSLKEIIFEAEKTKAELVQNERKMKEKLNKEKETVERIRLQLEQSLKKVNSLINDYNSNKEKIEIESKRLSDAKSQLLEIKSEIKSLTKISIFISLSGEIKTENFGITELGSELDNRLLSFSEADELTMKMLKRMSQILKIQTQLKKEEKNFEIKFEDETAELLFEKVTNAII